MNYHGKLGSRVTVNADVRATGGEIVEVLIPEDVISARFVAVRDRLADFFPLVPPSTFQAAWGEHVAEPQPDSRFYGHHAFAFNSVFYFKNFLKCLVAVEACKKLGLDHREGVYDLGAGAGPFSLAAFELLKCRSALLIDLSGEQLRIAKKLLSRVDADADCTYIRAKAPDDVRLGSGLPLTSYWLQEYEAERPLVGLFQPDALLDRPFIAVDELSVIERAKAALPTGVESYIGDVEFSVQGLEAGVIENDRGSFGFLFRNR